MTHRRSSIQTRPFARSARLSICSRTSKEKSSTSEKPPCWPTGSAPTFKKGATSTPKTALLASHIADLETIVTRSELEALILESNLIKRHRPRFNIVLRDDKQYPYLRLPIKEDFPRLSIVRRVQKDGALYYGPYTPAGALRETLKVIKKVFPLATCDDRHRRQGRARLH